MSGFALYSFSWTFFFIKVDVKTGSTFVKTNNIKVVYKHIRKDGTEKLFGIHNTKVRNYIQERGTGEHACKSFEFLLAELNQC